MSKEPTVRISMHSNNMPGRLRVKWYVTAQLAVQILQFLAPEIDNKTGRVVTKKPTAQGSEGKE